MLALPTVMIIMPVIKKVIAKFVVD
ncbi:MAG: hypothetical protein JXP36_07460 [Bacteroidales bacterium]|nr:hypothetical protein [Bacteroidales bacterium]